MRVFSKLALVALLCVLLSQVSIAAKAAPAETRNDPNNYVPIPPPTAPDGGPNEIVTGTENPSSTAGLRGPEENFVGIKVGSTWYDKQHNGSVGRMIAQGSDGRIHMIWNHKWGSTGIRSAYYNSVAFEGGQWVLSHDTSGIQISGDYGGYCNMGVWGDLSVPAWHEGPTNNLETIHTGIEAVPGSAAFTVSSAPLGATCSGATSNGSDGNGNYYWPKIDVDLGSSNDPIVHAVGHESTGSEVEISCVYFRGLGNPTDYGSCGIFVDSVTTIAGIVRQDPNSDKVALVWMRPRHLGPDENQLDHDVLYSESFDQGVTWGTPINITNHVDEDLERPYSNLSAIYTSDGCLHIVWDSPGYFYESGTISIAPCNMYHWDDCNQCRSLVVAGQNTQSCRPESSFNRNLTKMNLVECEDRLYVVYTWFAGDSAAGTEDCSQYGYSVGELYASVSETNGLSWSAPFNLTNTYDNGCAPGECEGEQHSSSVMYADSLYTMYVGDTDPGRITGDEGTWTECPIMFMVNPCFAMEPIYEVQSTPAGLGLPYPLSMQENTQLDTSLTLISYSNLATPFSVSVSYLSGSGWLETSPTSGSIDYGCDNTFPISMTITAPPVGFYQAEIEVSYADQTLMLPVDLWSWNVAPPEEIRLHTFANALDVATDARAAHGTEEGRFYWNADNRPYLSDGGLILGNAATGEYDFNLFHYFSEQPTTSNPWGRLLATCCAAVDTAGDDLRSVAGSGVNHDSTIQFDATWYCDGHPDSAEFYVLHLALAPGPNFSEPLDDVVIAYGADWDIPADTNVDNWGFANTSLQTVYQQGRYTGSPTDNDLRFGGIAYRGHDESSKYASGGLVWDNPRYVYPANGYHVDTLQNRLPNVDSWSTDIPDSSAGGADLSSIIVIDNNATIGARDNLEFNLVFWAINPNSGTSSQVIDSILYKAEAFICSNGISPNADYCWIQNLCGSDNYVNCQTADANGDGLVNITDAVYLIHYVFAGGDAPRPWSVCSGDFNSDCVANITDCVLVIQWIFAGVPPRPCEHWIQNCDDPGDFNPGPWE